MSGSCPGLVRLNLDKPKKIRVFWSNLYKKITIMSSFTEMSSLIYSFIQMISFRDLRLRLM